MFILLSNGMKRKGREDEGGEGGGIRERTGEGGKRKKRESERERGMVEVHRTD